MKMKIFGKILFAVTALLAGLVLPVSLYAEQFAGYDMELNSSAAVVDAGATLRLTPSSGGKGSAYIKTPGILNANTDFSVWFAFNIHDGSGGGADGMTFTVQNDPEGAQEVGSGGGGLGYLGTSPSVAVEVDTYLNAGDPNSNHIGINLNGSTSSIATWTSPDNLEGGTTFYIWIDYTPRRISALPQQLAPQKTRMM
jgi:hypothetical protein